MLHIVNKSPFTSPGLASCLKSAQPGSTILLIEDGVYAGLGSGRLSDEVAAAAGEFELYALKPDVDARGIGDKLMDGIATIGYDGFVDLVAENSGVQSWL